MKLPNGYGSIHKLPGKRRNPYRVRKTAGWVIENGKSKQQYINIGYYEKYEDALAALVAYNTSPYTIRPDITFSEVYEKWSERKFDTVSASNVGGYKAAYNRCTKIKDMKFKDIRLSHLQSVMDDCDKGYASKRKLKVLFGQLFDYAVQNEIIGRDKHIVEYVDCGKSTKSTKHYRFTYDEIQTLWNHAADNEYIQVILILIYTGVRPGELFNVKRKNVNVSDGWIYIEKGKTENATRKIPIHEKILPFVKYWYAKNKEYLITDSNGARFEFDTSHRQYTDKYWKPQLSALGILEYTNDHEEIKEHMPDDTRHTFTTMWKEKHLDEASRRKIQGHSGKGIGEMVYTHFDFENLRTELNKL